MNEVKYSVQDGVLILSGEVKGMLIFMNLWLTKEVRTFLKKEIKKLEKK